MRGIERPFVKQMTFVIPKLSNFFSASGSTISKLLVGYDHVIIFNIKFLPINYISTSFEKLIVLNLAAKVDILAHISVHAKG